MLRIKRPPSGRSSSDTDFVTLGRAPEEHHGFVNTPVYRASTVISRTTHELLEKKQRYIYGRRGTPTLEGLEQALSSLEGAKGCVLCPSGLSACTTALLAVLRQGDHLLMTDAAYEPVRRVCNVHLKRYGIETTYYDPCDLRALEAAIRPETRAIYLESPSSYTFEVQDVSATCEIARRHGIYTLADNTWATPLFFKPLEHGANLVIHAATKYISGHSDSMIGAICSDESTWESLKRFHADCGLCVGPDDAFLASRGLRSLPVRLRQHERSALAIARWLSARTEVRRILHPAIDGCPGHDIWTRDYAGSSGLFSFILHPVSTTAVAAFLDGLRVFSLGFSWGGFESLAVPFTASNLRTLPQRDLHGTGVRLHVGLEDAGELIQDLEAGLERMTAVG